MSQINYKREITGNFNDVISRAEKAIASEGMSVLTRIDFAKNLKERLGQDIPPLTILGACNPELAYQAFNQNPDVTSFIPCNVVVRQVEAQKISVEVVRPTALVEPLKDDEIYAIGFEAEQKLKAILEKI